MENKWLVVINPNAGNKRGKKDWPVIQSLLKSYSLDFEAVFTEEKNHAIRLTAARIEKGFRNIIAVGGDGTLSEVLNGIFIQKLVPVNEIILGAITVGTGNDWGKTYGIPKNYQQALDTIVNGDVFLQDVGKISFTENGTSVSRYFINNTGIGFDGLVASKVNEQKEKGKGGIWIYLSNLFTSLIKYKPGEITISVDGEPVSSDFFSLSVGVCKYNGNGMMQLPHAIPDDGILDGTLIRKMSKTDVLMNVKNLFDGSFIHHPKVATFKGKIIKVDSLAPLPIEADGETLGTTPCTYEILPKAVQVKVSKNFERNIFNFKL